MDGRCTGCGASLDTSAAAYSASGDLICRACEAKETIHEGDRRAADAIFGAALSSLVLGLVSIFCNPFLILTFASISAGAGALFAIARHPEYRTTLGTPKWITALVCAVLGILLASIRLALIFLITAVVAGS